MREFTKEEIAEMDIQLAEFLAVAPKEFGLLIVADTMKLPAWKSLRLMSYGRFADKISGSNHEGYKLI